MSDQRLFSFAMTPVNINKTSILALLSPPLLLLCPILSSSTELPQYELRTSRSYTIDPPQRNTQRQNVAEEMSGSDATAIHSLWHQRHRLLIASNTSIFPLVAFPTFLPTIPSFPSPRPKRPAVPVFVARSPEPPPPTDWKVGGRRI